MPEFVQICVRANLSVHAGIKHAADHVWDKSEEHRDGSPYAVIASCGITQIGDCSHASHTHVHGIDPPNDSNGETNPDGFPHKMGLVACMNPAMCLPANPADHEPIQDLAYKIPDNTADQSPPPGKQENAD